MNRRSGSQSSAGLVNRYIGSAFDTVKIVADSIDDVVEVASNIEAVEVVASNIEDLQSINENMEVIKTAAETTTTNVENAVTAQGLAELARDGSVSAKDEVLNRVASYEVSSAEYLINTFDGSSLSEGSAVKTLGFTEGGDGGDAIWIKTADTTTVSLRPVDMGEAKLSDSAGNVFRLVYKEIKPKKLGAFADSTIDDGAVLNLCTSIFRSDANNATGEGTVFDGEGLSYYTTESLDFTNIAATNYKLQNITVLGACTGKIVMNFIGSRYGIGSNVKVIGDKDNRPSVGILFARSADGGQFGFCDGWNISQFTTLGWFSLSGMVAYGQESTHYDTCRFWNYDQTGRGAIFTGDDEGFTFESDYSQPSVGPQSYIQNTYSDVEVRYLPFQNALRITSITQSNPAVVTATYLGDYVDGDYACMHYMNGMEELEGLKFEVANINTADNTFELVGVDSTNYSEYVDSGIAILASTHSALYFARGWQHKFIGCYVVGYGQPPIEISMVTDIDNLDMDMKIEGSGFSSLVHISNITRDVSFKGFKFKTYKTLATESIISSEDGYEVNLYDGSIHVATHTLKTVDVLDNPSKYNLLNINVSTPYESSFNPDDLISYSGVTSFSESNKVSSSGIEISGSDIAKDVITYTPTLSFSVGDIGAYTVNNAAYVRNGAVVNFAVHVSIQDVGTGSGFLRVTLPSGVSPAYTSIAMGRENAVYGSIVQGVLAGSSMSVRFVSSGSFVDDVYFLISGTYISI